MQFPDTSIDTETLPFRRGRMAPPLVCLSFAEIEGRVGLLHHSEAAPFVKRTLNGGAKIIGQNFAYDAAVLMAHDPSIVDLVFEAYDADRIHDVMIREQLIDLRRGQFRPGKYDLETMGRKHLGVELNKDDWRTWYENLRDKPLSEWPDGAKRYAIDDAITARDLYIEQGSSPSDEANQTRAALWLHLCAVWGIRTNPERVEALAGMLEAKRDKIRAQMLKAGLVRADGSRNMKNVKERVKAAYLKLEEQKPEPERDAKPWPLTDTGQPCTDAETCDNSGDALLRDYGEMVAIGSKLSNYVPVLRMGIVHARYGLAETGRTTCTIYLGKGNLQNLPRDGGVRECYEPRPGCVFIGSDFDGLELRTVAQVCLKMVGHSFLAKALNGGMDPHLVMAAKILNIEYAEAVARYNEGDKEVKNARQASKPANFGFAGGMGAERFVAYAASNYGVTLTLQQARNLKAQWLATWPEFFHYHKIAPMQDVLVHLFSNRVRGGDLPYTELCNGPFQGLGADAAKRAGWFVTKACYVDKRSPLYGSRVVLFAHDEFLLETRDNDNAPDAAAELGRLMCKGANEFLPDVPATTTPTMMRYYSKNSKPIKHWQTGRLVPWSEELEAAMAVAKGLAA